MCRVALSCLLDSLSLSQSFLLQQCYAEATYNPAPTLVQKWTNDELVMSLRIQRRWHAKGEGENYRPLFITPLLALLAALANNPLLTAFPTANLHTCVRSASRPLCEAAQSPCEGKDHVRDGVELHKPIVRLEFARVAAGEGFSGGRSA